jgi:hypothetical protein
MVANSVAAPAPSLLPCGYTVNGLNGLASLSNLTVRATKPATQLAVDVLQHRDVPINVSLIKPVQVSSCEFIQHGRALCDESG